MTDNSTPADAHGRRTLMTRYPGVNLRFLLEFMEGLGVTPASYAEIGHGTASALRMQLQRDDMKLSRAMEIVSDLGYELTVEMLPPEQRAPATHDNYEVRLPDLTEGGRERGRDRGLVRLRFLEALLRTRRITQRQLAAALGYTIGAVQAWLNSDDMLVSHINAMKDTLGMRVVYTITKRTETEGPGRSPDGEGGSKKSNFS